MINVPLTFAVFPLHASVDHAEAGHETIRFEFHLRKNFRFILRHSYITDVLSDVSFVQIIETFSNREYLYAIRGILR